MIKIEVVTYEFDEGTCFEEIVSLAKDALVCSVDIMDEDKVKTSTNGGGYCRLTEPVDITFYNYEIGDEEVRYDEIILEHIKEVRESELRSWFEGLEDGYYELVTHFEDEGSESVEICFDDCVPMKSDAESEAIFKYLDMPHDGAEEVIRDINDSTEVLMRLAQQVGLPYEFIRRISI